MPHIFPVAAEYTTLKPLKGGGYLVPEDQAHNAFVVSSALRRKLEGSISNATQ